MNKVAARWVPRLLTADQKLVRSQCSRAGLERINRNSQDFWRRFIIADETWVHHYTPESKRDSMQWTTREGKAPAKAKAVSYTGKVMATVFWDAKGILLVDFLLKGSTITGHYYATLLDQLNEAIQAKWPHMKRKKVLFHQDNAPSHKSTFAVAKLHEYKYEIIEHLPYSPDLASSDFFLFPKLKETLSGQQYSSDEEVMYAVNAFFDVQDGSFFSDGIKGLEYRWTKCIDVQKGYIEK